jgi:hypothetical protein
VERVRVEERGEEGGRAWDSSSVGDSPSTLAQLLAMPLDQDEADQPQFKQVRFHLPSLFPAVADPSISSSSTRPHPPHLQSTIKELIKLGNEDSSTRSMLSPPLFTSPSPG